MDHRYVEENLEWIRSSLQKRNNDFNLAEVLDLMAVRNTKQKEHDDTKFKANEISNEIGLLFKQKADPKKIDQMKLESSELKKRVQTLNQEFLNIDLSIKNKLLYLPNVLDSSVVPGQSEMDNPTVAKWSEPKSFTFPVQSHDELGQHLGILDFERASKMSGARFSVLTGDGAKLERALVSFMIDQHVGNGYTEMSPPYMVNREAMVGTGQLPKFEDEAFAVKDPEYFLIPTAEVPVTNYYRDEVLEESQLPKSFVSYTPCFRKEAGSYGKDTKGLIRQHQFHKVELMRFVHPNHSVNMHEELTMHARKILESLELPYRVVSLCSQDIGFSSAKTYDIEVWLPSQNKYREISSCSNFLDFQARRANIRYKPKDGSKPRFVHTLNGSGLAVGRTWIAVLENHQNEDGSIQIPKVLVPYMGGQQSIKKL